MSNLSLIAPIRSFIFAVIATFTILPVANLYADSVNSPNITLNVDTNRSTGNGAGNVAVTVNTVTIAEITLAEYSAGNGKSFTIKAKPGYQFDPTSNITAQSATFGINGGALNAVATVVPIGSANETITFNLTSASSNSTSVQDIIRINGIKLKILSAAGAVGPAQTTIQLTTSTIGGAFTNQGIVAANITRGAADHLEFAAQPGNNQAGGDILPQVKIVDFGGNLLTNVNRSINLTLQTNPGSATLNGTAQRDTANGTASWIDADNLNLTVAASGYVLRATQTGAAFLTSNSVDSAAFAISPGNPGGLIISTQPTDTTAGGDITLAVTAVDEFSNPLTGTATDITLDSATNPGGWPLLVDTSLTKTTVNGVATWDATDNLRINKSVSSYTLRASGLGAPVVTNAFNITPASASLVSFIQQPSTVIEEQTISPSPSVEITDAFGNRIDTSTTVNITLGSALCNGDIVGGSESTSAGIATFDALSVDVACDDAILNASVSGIVGGSSDTFDVKAKNSRPIALKLAQLQKGKQFKFNASGNFKVSSASIDDPTKNGAVLTVTGTTGSVRYLLPKSGWKKSGTNGFQFSNSKCKSVILKKNSISAECNSKTGTINIPETTLDIVLDVGKGTAEYCGECGGTSKGNESKKFQRVNCAKPTFCP